MKMSVAERKKLELQQMKDRAKAKKEIEKFGVDAYSAGQKDATVDTVYLFLWVLKERFGFGSKRLQRVYEEAVYFSECINDPKTGLSIDDIKQVLLEENKLRVR